MSKRLKVIISLVLLLLVAGGVGFLWVKKAIYSDNVQSENEQHIYWEEDLDLDSVVTYLSERSILSNNAQFKWVAQQKKMTKAKAGHYLIEPDMSNNELVNIFRSGLQTPIKVTFIAQSNVSKVCKQIATQLRLSSSALHEEVYHGFKEQYELDIEEIPAYFLPNTYEFFWTASPKEFMERMKEEYDRFWNVDRFSQAQHFGLSPLEVATLASIVDGETHQQKEMSRVAGLYINRLNRGMKLQSDPTVRYAIKEQKGEDYEIRRVLNKDLKIPSPYNTYYKVGLPPGPISIPSMQAISAVLNAESHSYIYMCANPETGLHDFTASYAQHERNAARYRRWLDKNRIKR